MLLCLCSLTQHLVCQKVISNSENITRKLYIGVYQRLTSVDFFIGVLALGLASLLI